MKMHKSRGIDRPSTFGFATSGAGLSSGNTIGDDNLSTLSGAFLRAVTHGWAIVSILCFDLKDDG